MGRLEHGTPEGYEAGCTSNVNCPAMHVHGMSCETAYLRFVSGERRYMQLRGRGLTSTAIAKRLGFNAAQSLDRAIEQARYPSAVIVARARFARVHPETPAPEPVAAPPLAERANDPEPQEDASEAIETETATAPVVEDEAMGHHTEPTTGKEHTMTATATPARTADGLETYEQLTTDQWTTGMTQRAKTEKLAEIRAWARSHGHPDIPSKGKIPQAALHDYAAAHPVDDEPVDPITPEEQDELAAAAADPEDFDEGADTWPGNDGTRLDHDPTHGRIDKDIQEAVADMNPSSL